MLDPDLEEGRFVRAVHLRVPERELAERHSWGADRWDEMWEGELHMVPPPSLDHQGFVAGACVFLTSECRRRGLGRIFVQAGLFDPARPDTSYRVPDLMFVAAGHEQVLQAQGVVGAADAVIEVRSPDDETYEKFGFFAHLGVREVIVLHPQTHRPEVYRLAGRQYVAMAADADGWVRNDVLGVRMRHVPEPVALRLEALDAPEAGVDL